LKNVSEKTETGIPLTLHQVKSWSGRVARFFWIQNTKAGKKYTK
jgi:hypothetical protein